jgi:VanZ family protein
MQNLVVVPVGLMSTFDPPHKPRSLRLRLLFWTCLAIAWWTLIFVATHIPIQLPGPVTALDKYQHAAAFLGLAVLLCAAYEAWRPRQEWGYLGVFLAAGAYGAIDEWTQSFVGRQSDVLDWFADLGGVALGVGLMFLFAARSAAAAAASADASAVVKTR